MARRARCGWVRSGLTQEVKAIAAARPRIDAARPKLTSGQRPFLGSGFWFEQGKRCIHRHRGGLVQCFALSGTYRESPRGQLRDAWPQAWWSHVKATPPSRWPLGGSPCGKPEKGLAAALRLLPRPPAWAASRALPQAFFWLP